MLTIVIISVFVFASIFVFGIGVLKLLDKVGWKDKNYRPAPDIIFLFGLSVLTAICGWLSLFIPINEIVLIAYTALVAAMGLAFRRHLAQYLSRFFTAKPSKYGMVFTMAFVAVLVMLTIDFSFMGIIYYDTGLYHIQSIEWIRNYSAVAGLGNLHDRLAFNSMVFPLAALFTFLPDKLLVLPLNLVVCSVLAGRLTVNCFNAISAGDFKKFLFYLIVIALFFLLNVRQIYSASTDLFSGILVLYILIFIFEKKPDAHSFSHTTVLMVLLIVMSVTVKLSTAPILLLLLHFSRNLNRKLLSTIAVTGVLFFCPFLIRNYILSGYLVFPFPAIDLFNPDWKVPLENVAATRDAIKAWARVPHVESDVVLNMPLLEWLPKWWATLNSYQLLMVGVNIVGLPLLTLHTLLKNHENRVFHIVLLLYLTFWFITAPDPRFAEGVLIFNTAYFCYLLTPGNVRVNQLVLYPVLAATMFIWTIREYQVIIASVQEPLNWVVPRSAAKSPKVEFFTTNFTYSTPVANNQCHSAPIPCTPYPKENLVLRKSGLSSGFKIENQPAD